MFRIISVRLRFAQTTSLVSALIAAVTAANGQTMPAALPEDLVPELRRLLDSAVKQSPTTLARSLDVAQREADYIMDRSAMLPSLSGYGSYSFRETAISANEDSKSSNDGFFYNASFNQPIFHWGALKNQTEISKLSIRVAEKQYAEAYRTLALSIRTGFLQLIIKKMQLRNQQFYLRASESFLALQEARLRDGRISAGEITAPRLAVDEARIFSDQAQVAYDSARRTLAALAGVSEVPDEAIPADLPRPAFAPETLGAYFESMKSFNPEETFVGYNYAMQIRQSDLRYKIARVRLLPKFSVNASYSQENLTTVAGNVPIQTAVTSTNISFTGFWTIFDGLATRGAKLSALAAKRLAERNLQTFKDTTSEQVRLLERQVGFAGRLMDLTETRKQLALAAVKKIADDVKSGVSSQTGLDQFTITAQKAELDALNARAEFLAKWSEYVSLLGVDPILNNVPARYLRNGR